MTQDEREKSKIGASETKRVTRLKRLTELSMTLSGEPIDIFKKIAQMIGELLEVSIVCLSEIKDEKLHFLSVYRAGDVMSNMGSCDLANTPCATVQVSKDLRVYHDVIDKFPKAVFLKDHNAYSYCGFPAMDSEGNVVSVICLLDTKYHDFTDEDRDLLMIFSQRIGVEIERKKRIKERKKAQAELARREAEFEAIFNSISDGVIFVDTERRIIMINRAVTTIFGYPFDELEGKTTESLYADKKDFDDQGKKRFYVGAQQDQPVFRVLYRRKNGITFIGETLGAQVNDLSGKPIGFVGIIRDITARVRMEEELNRLEKLESLGVLAGGIAHDFNNLLMGIMGNLSLAKMHLSPDHVAYSNLIHMDNASARAQSLTQQLLTFSKGGQPVKKLISLTPLLEETASFSVRGSNVKCDFSIPADLCQVEVDPGQLSQVISNLVINGVQAMPNGGIIRVTCQNVFVSVKEGLPLPAGRYVKVTIQDQGAGISPSYLDKIFDPYFTTKQKGTGLGLASAYSIIKKHGGHIAVESELEFGTTFHFYLPAEEMEVTADAISKKATKKTVSVSDKGKVLIMDDDEFVRDIACEMLSVLGYEVDYACDGKEAIDKYCRAKEKGYGFNLVVMDLTIPAGMGGREAISKLKTFDPKVKAIVSSGYSNDPVMADYRKYGFLDVVSKPYDLDILEKVVSRVLSVD